MRENTNVNVVETTKVDMSLNFGRIFFFSLFDIPGNLKTFHSKSLQTYE